MKLRVSLYVISAILAIIGIPTVLVVAYLDFIDSGIPSKFFWAASVACCVLSIIFFSLAPILATWEEEDDNQRI